MEINKDELTLRLQRVEKQIYMDFQELCKRHDIPFFVSGGTAIGAIRHKCFIPWDDDIDVCMLRSDYDRAIHYIRHELSDKYDIYDCCSRDGHVLVFGKMCKKGTKIQEDTYADTNNITGIFIDLFPYDKTTSNMKKRKKQIWKTWFWARMMVLSVYGHPRFPDGLKGIKLKVSQFICLMIHYFLKFMHMKKEFFYKKYLKEATKYNKSEEELYTDFSYSHPEKVMCTYDMIFPLKEMPFEDITVQMLNNADKYLTSQYGDYMKIPPIEKRITHNPGYVDFGDGNIYRKES